MPLISLADIAGDDEFSQEFMVNRSSGSFGRGRYHVDCIKRIPFWGIIQPASPEDLLKVKEADRKTGSMSFISTQELYSTWTEGIGHPSGLSDTILWRGSLYSITVITPWMDFGFCKAVGVRGEGA